MTAKLKEKLCKDSNLHYSNRLIEPQGKSQKQLEERTGV